MPVKRKASTNASAKTPVKQLKQDGQKAVSKELNVPVDEGFHGLVSSAKVFIGDDGIIYDAALNQTNIGVNSNKFYRIQLLEFSKSKSQVEYYTHTRWGRVGDYGQVKTMGPDDLATMTKEFEKKFKDKSGLKWEDRSEDPKKGKYTFIERSYEDDEDEDDEGQGDGMGKMEEGYDEDEQTGPKSKLAMPVQRLVELIFNESHFNSVLENIGYNNNKLPLGKLSKATLTKGFEALKELASLIKHPKLAQDKYNMSQGEAIENASNKYYTIIPHVFGRQRALMIDNYDILNKEVAMLDTLSDMEIANSIMKTTSSKSRDADSVALIDKRFEQLKLDHAIPLEKKTTEYQLIKKFLINTAGKTHNVRYHLHDIFRIGRTGEDDRFEKAYGKRKDSCRRLLWHGSRTTNFGGILSQGLRIAPPEAPVSGYAFGKGIYMADISTKSANYCATSSSGRHGLLLLCEAELGSPVHELLTGDSNAAEDSKKNGFISTQGMGRIIPPGWVDAGAIHESLNGVLMPDPDKEPEDQQQHPTAYLQYNEYIVYDVAQVRLRYLIRFEM